MSEPHAFTPETREALGRTLEATRNAMAEVHDNVRILEESRDRADKRIELLKADLAHEREALAEAAATEKALREELGQGAAELDETQSELAAATTELAQHKARVEELTVERDELVRKLADFDRVVTEKTELEVQLGQAADLAESQDETIASLKQQLEESRAAEQAGGQALDAAHADLADALRTHEDQQAASQEQILGLQDELKQAGEGRIALESELADFKTDADQRISGLEENAGSLDEEKRGLSKDLAEARGEIEGQNAQLASELELRKALEVNLDVARRAIRELKESLDQAYEGAAT